MFSEKQLADLNAPLARERVKQRQGAGRHSLSYIEAWDAIAAANAIFGHGNWSRETVLLEALHDPKLVPDEENPSRTKVVAAFLAKARVTVWSPDGQRSIVREGCGAARGFAKTAGEAMENALKAAETDALKRALVTFGNAFGLALYDKEQRNVGTSNGRQTSAPETQPRAPIDEGFDRSQPSRKPLSQRALVAVTLPSTSSGNGRDPIVLPY
jgi:DNA repair and recombination protein RAD52